MFIFFNVYKQILKIHHGAIRSVLASSSVLSMTSNNYFLFYIFKSDRWIRECAHKWHGGGWYQCFPTIRINSQLFLPLNRNQLPQHLILTLFEEFGTSRIDSCWEQWRNEGIWTSEQILCQDTPTACRADERWKRCTKVKRSSKWVLHAVIWCFTRCGNEPYRSGAMQSPECNCISRGY